MAISRFAAQLRKSRNLNPNQWRASEWKATPGASGTLKDARPALVAEITRQEAIAKGRESHWSTMGTFGLYRPMSRMLDTIHQKREHVQKLAGAPSFALITANSEGTFRLGDCLIAITQTVECDWERYSKAWHRSHGPARSYSTAITVSRWEAHTLRTKRYPQPALRHIDRRAVEAVADFLSLPKLRGKQGLRIHAQVELVQTASPSKRCTVYERKLGGETIGYVAARRDQHYHASTPQSACDGVTEKIVRARLAQQRRAVGVNIGIDLDRPLGAILRGLGFCREGTADALDILGLEDSTYEAGELLNAGRWEKVPAVARKYPAEVATVAALVAGKQLPAVVQQIVNRLS